MIYEILVTGIVTCFLDFLTTEIITLLVPVLLVLMLRKEKNRLANFKECFKFVAFSCALWVAGYVGMWLAKWILASLILKINAMDYVKDEAYRHSMFMFREQIITVIAVLGAIW